MSGDPERLELLGEVCPFTFVRTKLRLEELPSGARLLVVVDHPPAARSVPRSAAGEGHVVLGVTERAGDDGRPRWEILLQRA